MNLEAQEFSNSTNSNKIVQQEFEIPELHSYDTVIYHLGYSLVYNEKHEQATWVAYQLTKKETEKQFERSNKFVPDLKISTGSATDADYAESGYDRGHLAPAGDMSWSATAMKESFFYSNMSPQVPSFNRGIWKQLEERARNWAIENDSIYIVTGPILTDSLPSIGPDKVSVPNYFYKVILDAALPGIHGIAFIIPNEGSKEPLRNYAVTIDSVEIVTGINFFPGLPEELREKLECHICIECWNWGKVPNVSAKDPLQNNQTYQCKGANTDGSKCHRLTKNANGFCFQHQNQSP